MTSRKRPNEGTLPSLCVLARELGLAAHRPAGFYWSHDALVDAAFEAYWRRRQVLADARQAALLERLRLDVARVRRRVDRGGCGTVTDGRLAHGSEACAVAHVRAWEPLCGACLVMLEQRRAERRAMPSAFAA